MSKLLDRIDLWICTIIALMIPMFTRAVPVFMVALIVTTFLRKETYYNIVKILKDYKFYILIFPFILMVVGYFYSNDKSEAFKGIETGSALIIFPFVMYFKSHTAEFRKNYHLLFKAYVLGVLVSYIVLWINIIPQYLQTSDTYLLYYTSFSQPIKSANHLSYNVLFAIIIVLLDLFRINELLFRKKSNFKTVLNILLFVVFSIYLFQLVAKSTILIYLLIITIVVVISYVKKIIKTPAMVGFVIIMMGLVIAVIAIPRVKRRFTNMMDVIVNNREIDYSQSESSTIRYSALISSVEIIKSNWLYGVGTGDVVGELEKKYEEHEYKAAVRGHTNPHNQYLRSFVMSGIIGLLSVIVIFLILFKISYQKKSFTAILWAVFMSLIFLVDDIFIFRDGVIYFAFFTSYFVFVHPVSDKFLSLREHPKDGNQ